MNNDSGNVKQIKPNDLALLLLDFGWVKSSHPNKNYSVYVSPVLDDNNEEIKIVMQSDEVLFYRDLNSVLELISAIHKIKPEKLLRKILFKNIDLFKQRIFSADEDVNLSLLNAAKIVSGLKDLVSYSACSEEQQNKYFEKRLKSSLKFVEKCVFGHTFKGSFGFSIEMQLSDSLDTPLSRSLGLTSIERKVMLRIAKGIASIDKAVGDGSPQLIVDNYEEEFNANMLSAMIVMLESIGSCGMEFSMLWSDKYWVPENLNEFTYRFIPLKTLPVLQKAEEMLKKQEDQDLLISGYVINLHADSILEDNSRRDITVNTKIERKTIKVKVSLDAETYLLAIDAHKNNHQVSLKGKLVKKNNRWFLEDPSDFKFLYFTDSF